MEKNGCWKTAEPSIQEPVGGDVMTPRLRSEAVRGSAVAETNRPGAEVRIEAVRVAGFRVLKDVCVRLDPKITVLVGENNTGKSALLEALDTAIGTRRPVTDDLHVNAKGKRVEEFHIDILLVPNNTDRFEQLRSLFPRVIRPNSIGESVGIRTVGSIRLDHSTVSIRRCFIEGWSGCDTPNNTEVVEIPGEHVSERHLTPISFTLLKANRDLIEEMHRRTSRWGRLLAQSDLSPEATESIKSLLQEASELVLTSRSLGRLRDRLDEVQQAIPTVEQVELEPLPSRIDDLTRSTDVIVNTPKGPRLPLRMQGLGSRSLAEIMVYRAFAAELAGIDEPYSPHTLACYEEPEAHLHPQAQHAVMNIIGKMNGQCIVTTHSPQIAGDVDFEQIRLFRYSKSGIEVRWYANSLDQQTIIKAQRLVERSQGQVFFARLVILVEGSTEYASLSVFARAHWNSSLDSRGITLVDTGSLEGAAPLVRILEDFGIPWLLFMDADSSGHKALSNISKAINKPLTRDSTEVVMLPECMNYEQYLVSEGLQQAIKQGISDLFGTYALSSFRNRNRGLDEDELLIRFLTNKKGTYGSAVAEAIIAEWVIPSRVLELLKRADIILGRAQL